MKYKIIWYQGYFTGPHTNILAEITSDTDNPLAVLPESEYRAPYIRKIYDRDQTSYWVDYGSWGKFIYVQANTGK